MVPRLLEKYNQTIVSSLTEKLKKTKPANASDQVWLKQRLEELRQQQLWQQGKVKEYYTELTDTVRVYLEEACGIQSTEMTTDQTLDAFHSSPASGSETEASLRQILQAADMVKFAKSQPQPYQHDLALGQAIDFIKTTWVALNPKTDNPDTENTAS